MEPGKEPRCPGRSAPLLPLIQGSSYLHIQQRRELTEEWGMLRLVVGQGITILFGLLREMALPKELGIPQDQGQVCTLSCLQFLDCTLYIEDP